MYSPREALTHAKTLLKYSPSAEQLNVLHNRIHDWLIEAKQKDADSPGVGKCAVPYEWLYHLVERVMEKQVSCVEAVQEIREYERE